jgi:hypothetical protein
MKQAAALLCATMAFSAAALPATAQTAGDINRLNAALQLCNSPAGAAIAAECAKLGAAGGGGAAAAAVSSIPGLGGKAGVAAGLLGKAMAARQQQQAAQAAAAAPPPAVDPAMQQALANCVAGAAGNAQVIQACLGMANAGASTAPVAATPVATGADPASQAAAAVPVITGLLGLTR